MNLPSLSIPEAVILIFLSAAAVTDLFTRKIPNLLILLFLFPGGFLLGPVFLGRLLLITLLFYPLTRFRLLGAGDVKLLSVAAGYFGMNRFLLFLFAALLSAALPSVILLLRGRRRARIPLAPFLLLGCALSCAAA